MKIRLNEQTSDLIPTFALNLLETRPQDDSLRRYKVESVVLAGATEHKLPSEYVLTQRGLLLLSGRYSGGAPLGNGSIPLVANSIASLCHGVI